jgi:hypothetical protein
MSDASDLRYAYHSWLDEIKKDLKAIETSVTVLENAGMSWELEAQLQHLSGETENLKDHFALVVEFDV